MVIAHHITWQFVLAVGQPIDSGATSCTVAAS